MSILGKLASVSSILAMSYVKSASDHQAKAPAAAIAKISGGDIKGTVEFKQQRYTAWTEIKVSLSGVTPDTTHGLSIKEGSDPESPGNTFDPFGKNHGAHWCVESKVGDLANIKADEKGDCVKTISDPYVKLTGPYSVVGKVLAVHENPDDLGFGRKPDSLTTGGVGKIIASGKITN